MNDGIAQKPTVREDEARREMDVVRSRRIMGLALILLFILLIGTSFYVYRMLRPAGTVASAPKPQGFEWVRSIYGWGTAEEELLVSPSSVAYDPDGVVWTAQPYAGALVGFNPDGTYAGMMTGGGLLVGPTSLDIAPDGTFYVVEGAQDMIRVLGPDDTEAFPELRVQEPMSIAVAEGLVVIGAKAGFAVYRTDGTFVAQLGTFGQEDGQFDTVNGIAISEDTIYISDQFNNRISAYDHSGARKWIQTMGAAGNQQGVSSMEQPEDERDLQMPMKLTLDSSGRLMVVDPFDFAITVYRPTETGLEFIAKVGDYGGGDGQFNYATAIDYDAERDTFAVADTLNDRIQIVRIPDSGDSVVAAAKRAATGPLRACCLPLALLFGGLLLVIIPRRRRDHHALDAEAVSSQEIETPGS